MKDTFKIEDFPGREEEKLRYGDMDVLGHVNNAAYVTLLESGRACLLNHPGINAWTNPDVTYVIARLEVDYRAEVHWPGTVQVGTAVKSIGRSSLVLQQAIFSGEKCVVTAVNVMVQVDKTTHQPAPISDSIRAVLETLMLKPGA